jgi:hypothetical protein
MKTKILTLLAISACCLRAEIQFSGYFITPNEALYTLSDTDGGESSGWLKAGDSFRGYSIASFDREREIITLTKDGKSLDLHLRESKVRDGKMTINGLITLGPGQQGEVVRASLFLGQDAAFPVRDGLVLHLTAERMADGNILYRPSFSTRGSDGKESSTPFPFVVARPGDSFSIWNGDLGFSFKP